MEVINEATQARDADAVLSRFSDNSTIHFRKKDNYDDKISLEKEGYLNHLRQAWAKPNAIYKIEVISQKILMSGVRNTATVVNNVAEDVMINGKSTVYTETLGIITIGIIDNAAMVTKVFGTVYNESQK